jgi:hypothetical protein
MIPSCHENATIEEKTINVHAAHEQYLPVECIR